jgi:hypothetical protein
MAKNGWSSCLGVYGSYAGNQKLLPIKNQHVKKYKLIYSKMPKINTTTHSTN